MAVEKIPADRFRSMAPKTNPEQPEDVSRFYDQLAGGYDSMTGFHGRFVKERPFFRRLVDRHGIKTAVDAGAGTGFHSLLLAQLGVHVTAVDLSPRMLSVLSDHAVAMGLSVRTVIGDLAELPAHVSSPVDAVFTLGNTLAHYLTPEALAGVLQAFRKVLRPGGILVSQILNYRKILISREHVFSTKEADGFRFTRQYDYGETQIRFTVTREDLSGRVPPEVVSVDLYPFLETEFVTVLGAAGFTGVQMYGGISMEPYDAGTSKDLIVIARPDYGSSVEPEELSSQKPKILGGKIAKSYDEQTPP